MTEIRYSVRRVQKIYKESTSKTFGNLVGKINKKSVGKCEKERERERTLEDIKP